MFPLSPVHLAFAFAFAFSLPLTFSFSLHLLFTFPYFPLTLRRWRTRGRRQGTWDAADSAADESRLRCCVRRRGPVGCGADVACNVEFSAEADAFAFESEGEEGVVSGWLRWGYGDPRCAQRILACGNSYPRKP